MGKKSTQTQTSGPSAQALPYLNQATSAVNQGYAQSQALAGQATNTLQSYLPNVVNNTVGNQTTAAAGNYDQAVLGGAFLGPNPYLDGQIANTDASVTNQVNGAIGTRGLAGGSAQADILSRELAKNETGLRYTDYTNQLGRMDTAAGNAGALQSANDQGAGTLLAYLGGTAALPQSVASQYASGINGLWGDSKTTTGTSTQPFGSALLGLAGAGLSGWASGGFKKINL